ncbi:A disintegrin and metalloproteinase with thrombospondin motifs 12, partial [Ophiophagus hannah]
MNQPCETLGLSHLSGMCQPHRSCNINEDSGLPLAFTIAHELGHSFGIQHDGKENDCEPVGRRPYIMSRQLQYDPTPLTWSRCSKEYITRFLDHGLGFCLDDVPKKKDLKPPFIAPGVIYDVHHQCQLQYGPNATFCDQVDNICQTLWCFVKSSCRSKLDAAADGTRCGENKWCFSGECITVGKSPEAINGAWGSWSPWSHCTRTCGAGVQAAERHCNNPEPQFGGKYCTGERKHYRMCNVKGCQKSTPNFREMQCSEFDTVAYKNEFYQWIPIYNTANPCELQCQPTNQHFSEKMLDAVIDGTPCFEGNSYRDVCINGMCKTVGCDYEINSNATEDQCGVCLGDGSYCQTVKITFNQSEGLGYVDIGLIPKGARHIKVVEESEAGNFLALRSEDPQKHYLNGGFIIQWNGDYEVAGTIFQWWAGEWQKCSTTCGPTGEKKRTVLCIQTLGLDEQALPAEECQHLLKPKTRLSCNRDVLCPSDWTVSNWTECTVTCGGGVRTRYVTCTKNNGEPCDVSKKPHSKALCGLQQCLSTQRLLMTHFKFHNGKIIRRIGAIPRRGPSKKLATPEPLPRIHSTIMPRLRNITLIPTSISLVNSSSNEDLEVKKLQNNSIDSSIPSNYSYVTSANRALQNITHGPLITAWTISSEGSSININKDSFTIDPMYNPKTNYLMEANDTNSTEREIKDYIQTERPTERSLTFTTSKSSRTSSTDNQPDNPDQFSVTPTRGIEVSSTAIALKGLRVQINPPVTSDPITEQPTLENTLEEKSANTTPSKSSFSETSPWATESPFVRDPTMPTNSENAFKTRLLNESDSENSRNLHTNAYWLVGNWTEKWQHYFSPIFQCSTTCGIGAFWRPVECNTKNESDCQHIKKPDPARRCYLRPCAQWRIGNWSKCSSSCGGGFKTRDAHCIDVREKRLLRPFHCQVIQSQPVLNMSCNMDPCFVWHTESWNECSASCGGGTQKRPVQCVRVDDHATKEENWCQQETKPPDSQKCNLQKCVKNTGSTCSKDRLSVNFCEKVRDIGKCSAPSVRIQCCQTCKRSLAVNEMEPGN